MTCRICLICEFNEADPADHWFGFCFRCHEILGDPGIVLSETFRATAMDECETVDDVVALAREFFDDEES